MMAESTENPGEYISCVKVGCTDTGGVTALLVTTNEERSMHLSRLFTYVDFPNREPEILLDYEGWIVDFDFDKQGGLRAITADGQLVGKDNIRLATDPLNKISSPALDGSMAIAGNSGLVWIIDPSGQVKEVKTSLKNNFFDAACLSADSIFVCGQGGKFLHFDGERWNDILLPTTVNLNTVSVSSEGLVIVAGDTGFVASGSLIGGFEVLDGPHFDVHGSCNYKGKFVMALPGYGVTQIKDGDIVDFQAGPLAWRVSALDNMLLCAEDDSILVYDGDSWIGIPIT